MDFMKVLDQTVREIKREVNLKVLKVPEIEQKVLDATSDEPWGPHGSALAEIALQTKKFTECQIIMNVLWTRLADTGANWRHVYKALAVIEYLVGNGSERAVDDIIEHSFQIAALSGFEYVEPNGKDMGINVRKKVEAISGLLNDREKIKAVRDKAAATRDKYFGLSSSGVTYKSSSASFSSSSSRNSGYGGFGGSKESENFKDSYKDYQSEVEIRSKYTDASEKSHEIDESYYEGNKSIKELARQERNKDSFRASKPDAASSSAHKADEDDFDDFDPRGSSAASFTQVDLFGDSLVGDLMDAPTPIPSESSASKHDATSDVDLFADAAFVSAPIHAGVPVGSHTQLENVDLFANQTTVSAAFPHMDLFGTSNSVTAAASKPPQPEPINTPSVDPFSAIPLNTFEGSDLFGSFTSNSNPVKPESSQNSESDIFGDFTSNSNPMKSESSQKSESDHFGDFISNSESVKSESSQSSANNRLGDLNQFTTASSMQSTRKNTFQVKSGIWADSLSRGIIDLNITAPKRISLADVGVVGALDDVFDGKEKGQPTSAFMGRAMGTGTGVGKSTFPSSTGSSEGFSNIDQHQQFGSFN